MVQSGFGNFMIPAIISIVLVGIIHGLLNGKQLLFWIRLAGGKPCGYAVLFIKIDGNLLSFE